MKKLFLLAFCTTAPLFCQVVPETKAKKAKIIVLTSNGGNGHRSACAVLNEALPEYELKLIDPIQDYFGKWLSVEGFYGSLPQGGWMHMANILVKYPYFFSATLYDFIGKISLSFHI